MTCLRFRRQTTHKTPAETLSTTKTMSTPLTDDWISLTPCPDSYAHFASPPLLVLNDNELILAPNTPCSMFLYKYNIPNDEWRQWFKYDRNINSNFHTAAINQSKSIIYLYNEEGRVIEIDLKLQKFKASRNKYHDGACIASQFINGQFHIFGGWYSRNKSHFIWNSENQQLVEQRKLKEIFSPNCLSFHCILYAKSKKEVIIIPAHSRTIWVYSLTKNECKPSNVALIYEISCNCAVLTNDERYILLFGTSMDPFTSFIQIIDLYQEIAYISNIFCPIKSTFKAVITNDNHFEEILCCGYIRKCWKQPQFHGLKELPFYMIKLIKRWFVDDIVHLFNRGEPYKNTRTYHWKIRVSNLTSS